MAFTTRFMIPASCFSSFTLLSVSRLAADSVFTDFSNSFLASLDTADFLSRLLMYTDAFLNGVPLKSCITLSSSLSIWHWSAYSYSYFSCRLFTSTPGRSSTIPMPSLAL